MIILTIRITYRVIYICLSTIHSCLFICVWPLTSFRLMLTDFDKCVSLFGLFFFRLFPCWKYETIWEFSFQKFIHDWCWSGSHFDTLILLTITLNSCTLYLCDRPRSKFRRDFSYLYWFARLVRQCIKCKLEYTFLLIGCF